MSTNYYAFGPGITDSEGLHSGQAAAGWRCLFRAHPGHGLTSAEAWRVFFRWDGIRIEAGHGAAYTADERMAIATERTTDNEDQPLQPCYRNGPSRPQESIDAEGNAFYDGEFC